MSQVLIIAEAGVNHNGDMNVAFKLIDAAVEAKVDWIKFQTFKAKNLVSKDASKAEYQQNNALDKGETQFQMLQKLELSHQQHEELIAYCRSKNINFFSTAFDLESLKYLADLGFETVKIPSGEITNLPYLKAAGNYFKKFILSTGMCSMEEIIDAVKVFTDNGIAKDSITILHCNTEYPTPMKDVNLKAMLGIREQLGTKVGYSDHTLGIEVPVAAVALGATIIEKHFTLDRTMDGPDHAASLEPEELKQMVQSIRNIELALGSEIKTPSESELKNIAIARKSLHLAHSLHEGHIIQESDLLVLRPGDGISPMQIDAVIGKRLTRDLPEFSKLQLSDLL